MESFRDRGFVHTIFGTTLGTGFGVVWTTTRVLPAVSDDSNGFSTMVTLG